jgi:hypothetical protein
MIPIKIANKKYKIKTIDELNTAEFIELQKIEKPDVLKYVAWQTKTTHENAFFAIISPTVEKAIGMIPDITKLSVPKWVNKKNIIDTVGQRHQIESSNLKGYELLILCLAVAQARSNNFEDIEKLKAKYLLMPFTEILPAGFFFFKIYNYGKSKGRRLLNLRQVLTKIMSLRNRQELTS